jgi:hypothetical protein
MELGNDAKLGNVNPTERGRLRERWNLSLKDGTPSTDRLWSHSQSADNRTDLRGTCIRSDAARKTGTHALLVVDRTRHQRADSALLSP